MIQRYLTFALLSFFISCGITDKQELKVQAFGEKIDSSGVQTIPDLIGEMQGKMALDCKIKGKVAEVSNIDGFWISLENKIGSPVIVEMRNRKFRVPADITGRTVYLNGSALWDTTNVERLRKYASDAGRSEAEIQGIRIPQTQIIIQADGILMITNDEQK